MMNASASDNWHGIICPVIPGKATRRVKKKDLTKVPLPVGRCSDAKFKNEEYVFSHSRKDSRYFRAAR